MKVKNIVYGGIAALALTATMTGGILCGIEQTQEERVRKNKITALESKIAALEKGISEENISTTIERKVKERVEKEVEKLVEEEVRKRLGTQGGITISQYDPNQQKFAAVELAKLEGITFVVEKVTDEYLASKLGFKFEYEREFPATKSKETTEAPPDPRLVKVEGEEGLEKYVLVETPPSTAPRTKKTEYTFEIEDLSGDYCQVLRIYNYTTTESSSWTSSVTVHVDKDGVRYINLDDEANNTSINLFRNSKGVVEYNPLQINLETAQQIFALGARLFSNFKSQHGLDDKIKAYTPKFNVDLTVEGTSEERKP